ncbi:680_t:CDS:1, partial [Entrophospora sp. SA101]
ERSMTHSGRSNDNRRHSDINQSNGETSTAETNRQNPEPHESASTENNEINATGNSDNMANMSIVD